MSATNIFDTRHIIKQTPKMGNRFLLTADSTQLNAIVNGRTAAQATDTSPAQTAVAESKLRKLNRLAGGDNSVFGTTTAGQTSYDILNLSLLSCTIPAFEFESGEVSRFNETIKHITKFTAVTDMNTVYYDYINGSATSIMLAWQSKVGFKLTGEIGYKSQYTCDMNLYVYGPNRPGSTPTAANGADDPKEQALMQFKILNAWPRSVDIGEYSYDTAEIKKVTVQFAYDIVIPVMIKSEGLAGTGLALQNFTSATENTSGTTNTSNVQNSGDDQLYNLTL